MAIIKREQIDSEYNEDNVFYCKTCLSLNIVTNEDINCDMCNNCGSTNIGETDIFTWIKMYRKKYNCEPNGFNINI
ncbi:MAG: hypothetical protein J6N78_00365 [Clostridia bacterium]|nr:hypothetical protein [Clostridia bacterium]